MTSTTTQARSVGIIVLAVITALIHLGLNFPDLIFILNGLGYLGLIAACYLPLSFLAPFRRWARWALIGFTALTIVLWVVFGQRSTIGYVDKAVEVLLLALLIWEEREQR